MGPSRGGRAAEGGGRSGEEVGRHLGRVNFKGNFSRDKPTQGTRDGSLPSNRLLSTITNVGSPETPFPR